MEEVSILVSPRKWVKFTVADSTQASGAAFCWCKADTSSWFLFFCIQDYNNTKATPNSFEEGDVPTDAIFGWTIHSLDQQSLNAGSSKLLFLIYICTLNSNELEKHLAWTFNFTQSSSPLLRMDFRIPVRHKILPVHRFGHVMELKQSLQTFKKAHWALAQKHFTRKMVIYVDKNFTKYKLFWFSSTLLLSSAIHAFINNGWV